MAGLESLLTNLPEIMGAVQIIAYVAFVLFFGSIAILGFRTYMHWTIRLLIRIGLGTLALISGIAIAPALPYLQDTLYQLMTLDIALGGIIASVILAVGMFLITYGFFNIPKIEKTIDSLKKRLDKARSKKSPKESKIIRIGGIVFLAVFIVFSLLNFHGFPDVTDRLPEEFRGIISDFGDISSECAGASAIIARHQNEILDNIEFYENPALEQLLEEEAGSPVAAMSKTVFEGKTIVMAVTQDEQQCLATETEACFCTRVQLE